MKNIIFGLLGFAAIAYAGGAAAFVAKKSNTGEFPYSEATQQAFIKDCSENANEWVCGCVLARLQGSYSEKEYLKLDADLQKGHEDYNFMSFLSKSVEECDEEYEAAASQITEEDAKAYVDTLLKNLKKNDYLLECSADFLDIHGKKGANKICGCVYNHIVKDKSRLVQVVLKDGFPGSNDEWGMDYVLECLPDKFTPEIEKNLIEFMNQKGLPKSIGQCMLNVIKKEYSLKAFAIAAKKEKDKLLSVFMLKASQCLVE